jgi:hypothetical protein
LLQRGLPLLVMHMTKILNIDALVKEERVMTIDGVSYSVPLVSVQNFIAINRLAEEHDAKVKLDAATNEDYVEFLIASVLIIIPSMSRDTLVKRSFDELNVIAKFARDGTLPEGMEPAVNGEEEKKPQS